MHAVAPAGFQAARARSDTKACEPPRWGSRMAVTSGAMMAIFTVAGSLG